MISESLHSELKIVKGDFFVKNGQQNYRIGRIRNGILRGFTVDNDGEEITTHFFMENDLVSGNYIPNIPSTMNIQALEDCLMLVANYKDVFSQVNTDSDLTNIILSNFQNLNKQNTQDLYPK